MTAAQEKILLETHGNTQKMAGCLQSMKTNIAENKTDIKELNKTLPMVVSKNECELLRNGTVKRHRNIWLITKDILLILLAISVFLFGKGVL